MYEYLNGLITNVNPSYIVIEVAGVGFLVNVANPYRYEEGQKQTVFVYQAVSENEISLYGFRNNADKKLFLNLIRVKGIGPKSALAILANEDHTGLINAINTNDVNYLKRFPKIGPKAAQQIILDLKGKLGESVEGDLFNDSVLNEANNNLEEASAALTSLGYSAKEVKRVIKSLEKEVDRSVDEYISLGLKMLMKG